MWLLVLAVSLCSLAVSDAIEHPKRRRNRVHQHQLVSVLQIDVAPRFVDFRPRRVVRIRCSVSSGVETEHFPTIAFFRQLDNSTIMPLSSGQRGVLIQTRAGTGGIGSTGSDSVSAVNRLVYQLTLGPEVHSYLQQGDNIFYCKGSDPHHSFTRREYFIVTKLTS